jgi:hypothetical protein
VVVIAVSFILGAALAAPIFFALGVFAGIDRTVSHERADIRPALRRSGR